MAYDESVYRRDDPDGTDPMDMNDQETFDVGADSPVPSAVLDDVFDDLEHGEPGRDRMGVHLLWEIVLLVSVVALIFLLYRQDASSLRGAALDALLVAGALLGMLAFAAGLTLRAGAPNLALGPMMVAGAFLFVEYGDRGTAGAFGAVLVAGVTAGAVLALVVVGLHVPGWAASLAAAVAIIAVIEERLVPVEVVGPYDAGQHAAYLYGGFAAVALLGGLFGAIRTVRRSLGRFRPVADPARRRGGAAAALTAGAIVVSMLLAALTGVVLAGAGESPVRAASGIEWTVLAFGASLLGGTSAFGRRGGVFGTLFAVTLLALFIAYAPTQGWTVGLAAVGAATIGLGLAVTRLVERYGRPRSADEEETWGQPEAEFVTWESWGRADRSDSWSSALPAQPTRIRSDWDMTGWHDSDR